MKNIAVLILISLSLNSFSQAPKKISQLPIATSIDSGDFIYVIQHDTSKRFDYDLIKAIKGDLTGGSGVTITNGTDAVNGSGSQVKLDSGYWATHTYVVAHGADSNTYKTTYTHNRDTTLLHNQITKKLSKIDTASLSNRIDGKADKAITINGNALSSNITLTQDQITEYLVTPGNRTRSGICYSDTFRIPSDTIIAGASYHPLLRSYGTDTTIVIYWISLNYKYKTAAYTSGGTDSIFLRTKYNGAFIKVVHIDDSYLSAVSGVGFFPVAVDKKDQGASWSLYIPHIYTVGAGSLWFRIKYYLVVRKLT